MIIEELKNKFEVGVEDFKIEEIDGKSRRQKKIEVVVDLKLVNKGYLKFLIMKI